MKNGRKNKELRRQNSDKRTIHHCVLLLMSLIAACRKRSNRTTASYGNLLTKPQGYGAYLASMFSLSTSNSSHSRFSLANITNAKSHKRVEQNRWNWHEYSDCNLPLFLVFLGFQAAQQHLQFPVKFKILRASTVIYLFFRQEIWFQNKL